MNIYKQKRECNNREIKRYYLEGFILQELEKNILNDEAISILSKALNEKMNDKNEINEQLLKSLEQKLDKVNKEISNILNAIMNGIVNNMLKDKLDELEQVKLNLDLKMNELKIENRVADDVCVTEDQIRSMFSRFKEFVLARNIPECKKFIVDYIKEVIVYKDHVEVVFNVVFSLINNEVSYDIKVIKIRK